MQALTQEQIKEIASEIDTGFVCNWNIKSNKLIFTPNDDLLDYDDSDSWDEELKEINSDQSAFRQIEKPDSFESFRIMEAFIDTLPDHAPITNKLINALNKKKPFREFKNEIDYSGEYRQLWFEFKDLKMIEYVQDCVNNILEEGF